MSNESKFKILIELIDKAGGLNSGFKSFFVPFQNHKALTFGERYKIGFNIWGFIFTFFYYLYHKMWKKALTLTVISFALIFVIDYFFPNNYITYVISSLIFGSRANIDLYKKYKLKSNDWI